MGDSTWYRGIIGSLQYLSVTSRSDITFATNYLAKFQEESKADHHFLALRIVRYLRATIDLRLTLKTKNKGFEICAYADSDLSNSVGETCVGRRSRIGVLVTVNGSPILWKSKRQTVVTKRST
jgi:hypothetical protein